MPRQTPGDPDPSENDRMAAPDHREFVVVDVELGLRPPQGPYLIDLHIQLVDLRRDLVGLLIRDLVGLDRNRVGLVRDLVGLVRRDSLGMRTLWISS